MEDREFTKRVDDLRDRAERRGIVTRTGFLTPAEQYALQQYYAGDVLVLTGGQAGCERQAAFFLPEHMAAEDFDPAEHIRAVKLQAHFGAPGHRDYLGAALGLGITRESLGDIRIFDDVAYLFCLPTVEPLLLEELKKVGRVSVTPSPCPLEEVPAPLVRVKALSFTVKSLRLDAVTAALFGLSRTAAAEQIRMGLVSLNYAVCEKADAPVQEGDVLSLRGHGKGSVTALGGRSKKDRLFVEAEIYL
jgi:RNA-binding protein YlmH